MMSHTCLLLCPFGALELSISREAIRKDVNSFREEATEAFEVVEYFEGKIVARTRAA